MQRLTPHPLHWIDIITPTAPTSYLPCGHDRFYQAKHRAAGRARREIPSWLISSVAACMSGAALVSVWGMGWL